MQVLERASPIVSQLVNEICLEVEQRSVHTEGSFTAEGSAKIRGLAGRLVGGGVELTADAKREVTEGVLQQDLLNLLQGQQDCRSTTFQYLMEYVLGEAEVSQGPAPPPQPSVDSWLRLERGEVAKRTEKDWALEVDYRVPLYKSTAMPLLNCTLEKQLLGPADLRDVLDEWYSNYRFAFEDFDWSFEQALEFAGETRTVYEVTLRFPPGTLPTEDIVFEAFFDCTNYSSPTQTMTLAAP